MAGTAPRRFLFVWEGGGNCRFEAFANAPNRGRREEGLIRDSEARTPLGAFGSARDRVMMGPALDYASDTRAGARALACGRRSAPE